jgi:cytochrome c551/c552
MAPRQYRAGWQPGGDARGAARKSVTRCLTVAPLMLGLVVFLASCILLPPPPPPKPSPSPQAQAAPVGAPSPSPTVDQAAASVAAGGSRAGAPSTAPSPAAVTSPLASASPVLAASPSAAASPVVGVSAGLPTVPFESGSADRGQAIFTRAGCVGCHAVNGVGGTIGPDLGGVATRAVERAAMLGLAGPREYFVQSIVTPQAYVVDRYMPVMLDWKQLRLTEQDLADLAIYLGTLSAP